jgi:hypothetical protein
MTALDRHLWNPGTPDRQGMFTRIEYVKTPKGGGYYDDVYERIGPKQWRIKSRAYVSVAAR